MTEFQLYLFGPPRLTRNGAEMHLPGRKIWALLAYLAVSAQPQSRDHLALLLWPEHSQTAARANLRRELSQLHTVTGDGLLRIERETVAIDPDALTSGNLWLDVANFQRLLESCRHHGHGVGAFCSLCEESLQKAVTLYSADFLSGFTLADCPDFDEWHYFQNATLRQALATVLGRLAINFAEHAAFDDALVYARRRLTLDRLYEPSHRQLMELYALCGERASALHQYEECLRLLREELGVAPEEETRALAEAIRTKRFPVSAPTPQEDKPDQPAPDRASPASHTLPLQLTPLVGRRQELAALDELLASAGARLITIVGPGGIGKTRLALEVAKRQTDTLGASPSHPFLHGAYFAPLAPLSEVAQIIPVLAAAMGFTLDSGSGSTRTPHEQVLDYLRQKQLLLVLDNFEHLLDGVALLTEILQAAPKVQLLVTSRERLRLPGEQLFPLYGLAFNQSEGAQDELASVTLFVQSAHRALPRLHFNAQEMEEIARICRMVEGMPLAIELAAAWVATLTPSEIAQEISQSLDFLAVERRGVPERHFSMRAVFEPTWQRLSERERAIFASLSVFRGGFTREAAQAVAEASLHDLDNLTAKSLIQHDRTRGRYTIHELLRQYGSSRLTERPTLEQAACDRHSAFFVALLQKQQEALKGKQQPAALAALDAEQENLSTAWRWSIAQGDAEQVAATLEGLGSYYQLRHLTQEGATLFEAAAALFQRLGAALWLALALSWQAGFLTLLQQFQQAGELLTTSLKLLDNPELSLQEVRRQRAFVLLQMGDLDFLQGTYVGLSYYHQSVALFEELDDPWLAAKAHMGAALFLNGMGQYGAQRIELQKALSLYIAFGNERGIAAAKAELASTDIYLGRAEIGLAAIQECLTRLRELGDRAGMATALGILGHAYYALCQVVEGRQALMEELEVSIEIGSRTRIAHSYAGLAIVEMQSGDYARAYTYGQQAILALEAEEDHPLVGWFWAVTGWASLYVGGSAAALECLHKAVAILDNSAGSADRIWGYALLAFCEWRGDLRQEARPHCLYALRFGYQITDMMVASLALSTAILLLAEQGHPTRAVELYALLRGNPFCGKAAWWLDTVGVAMQAVVHTLPSQIAEEALHRGETLDWWSTVADLPAELDG